MGEGLTEPRNHDRAHDRAAPEPTEHPTGRATVGEAAGILRITAEAVRSRIKRGTLESTKEGGTVYVLLEGRHDHAGRTAAEHDRTNAQTAPEPDQTGDRAELVDVLRDQVEYLREQLGEEREARRRADMLLARLAEANASMAGQIRELTAPEGGPGVPQSGAEASEGASPRSDRAGPQTSGWRPWWIRWFGG